VGGGVFPLGRQKSATRDSYRKTKKIGVLYFDTWAGKEVGKDSPNFVEWKTLVANAKKSKK